MRVVRWDDQATTAIVSFAVVITIYALAFAAFMSVMNQPVGQTRDAPALDARAESGLLDVLGTSGLYVSGSTNAKAWHKDPDNITRFGLLSETTGLLDLDKMRNLTKGSLSKASNGLLDYEEARQALALGDFDFHLRTYPLFDALEDAGALPVKNLEVAYVGNYSKKNSEYANYPVQYTSQLTESGSHVFVNVTITNNGTVDTVFQAEFSVPLEDGYLIDTANTGNLSKDPDGAGAGVGESQTVSLKLLKTASWRWAGSDKNVSVKINDPSKKVADFKVDLAGISMTSPAYSPATSHAAVAVDLDRLIYTPSQKPRIYYEVLDGDGDDVNNVDLNITIRKQDGTVAAGRDVTSGGSGRWDLDFTLAEGLYHLNVSKRGQPLFNSTDSFEVNVTAAGDFTTGGTNTLTEGPESKAERGFLAALVEGFVNKTYDDNSGDVYPGEKQIMNGPLATNLTSGAIDVLIVGSEVDQTALTSNSAKDAVNEFVFDGGLLIVLGSLNQQVTWLQPLFHATLTTSGDSLGVPDPSHPILHTPQELDYANYVDNGKTWQFNTEDDASHFTHVLVREGGNKQQDVLAVSKPGHFGNGTIVLTAWAPFFLTNPQNDGQAKNLFYNFLLQAWGQLYVDLGPRIPDHAEVASTSRMATAPSPIVAGERVLVRVVLYVFR